MTLQGLENKFKDNNNFIKFETEDICIHFELYNFIQFFKKEFSKNQIFIDYPKEIYDGKYLNGRREGDGIVTFSNGNKFIGKFKNGFPKEGTLQYSYGAKIIGDFNKNYELVGEGTLFESISSKDQICKLQDGKLSSWVIFGTKLSGRKTLFNHLKYLYSYKPMTIDNINQQRIRRDLYLYEIFTKFGKILMEINPKHPMIEEISSLLNIDNISKLHHEKLYFKNNIYPIIIKLMNDREFKQVMINNHDKNIYPEICFRLAVEIDLIWNIIPSYEDLIRCELVEFTNLNPVILDKEDLFSRIELLQSNEGISTEKSKIPQKYIFLVGLTHYLGFGVEKEEIINICNRLFTKQKLESEIWLVFTKKDLFDSMFSRKFSKFKEMFPKECEKFQISERDHEKAKKIIENSFNNTFKFHYLNTLDSNEVVNFINILHNKIDRKLQVTQKGKDLIQKEQLFINEYFFDIHKKWKFSVESIKLKIIEKILEEYSQTVYKWKNFETNDKNLKKYKFSKILGSGAFGKVYLCLKEEEIFALKRIVCKNQDELNLSVKECFNGRELNHINILRYNDIFYNVEEDDTFVAYIETEFYPIGNLFNFIETYEIDEIMIMDFCIQILKGLTYLHENDFAHRDLKPENILLKLNVDHTDFIVSISDLGSSKRIITSTDSKVGSEFYVAPEIMEGKNYTLSVDIFSFGAVLYVLLFKKPRFFYLEILKSVEETEKMIHKEFQSAIFSRNSFFKSIILSCLSLNPEKRPKAKDLLNKFKENL